MALHTQIRRWRNYRKLSQETLAHACGWSGQTVVSNYENDLRRPSADELPTLAAALGISLDDLYFGDPGKPGRQPQPLRLDPEKLKDANRQLTIDFAMANLAIELDQELDLLALAYDREMLSGDDRVNAAYTEAVRRRIADKQGAINALQEAGRRGPVRAGGSGR